MMATMVMVAMMTVTAMTMALVTMEIVREILEMDIQKALRTLLVMFMKALRQTVLKV